jgi:thiol-disulfide isomerase/thioredoxin
MNSELRFHLFLFILIFSTALFAAPLKTVIHGKLPGGAARYVRLYGYTNNISNKPVKISVDTIRNNDTFSVEFQMEKGDVKTVFFAVERFKSFDMYVEAGKTYHLVFDSLDFSIQDETYSPLTSATPNLIFHIPDKPDDLNNLINDLVVEFVRFSVEDFSEIMKTRNARKFEDFRRRLDSLFGNQKHPFFNTVLEYTLADIEFTARLKNNAYFIERYFNNRPFQYDNPAFMNFFNVFFDKYIYASSRKILFSDLEKHIVSQPNYKALLDSLGKDTLLKNEIVRDMVLIKNLHQMYFSNLLHRESIFDMMNIIGRESKFQKHRQTAQALLPEMNVHFLKQPAPPLLARKSDGESFSLDTLRGKYIYLFFFTTYCKVCYPEMIVLNNLYPKFSHSVSVVFVSMDMNFLKFYYFMQDHNYPWHFVNFYRNFDIEDDWSVSVYPQAFMIDPEMNIVNSNAPLPSEFLEHYFTGILQQGKSGN